MDWLWARIKGAVNSGVEGLIWAGVVLVIVLVWRARTTDVTLPAWLLAIALAVPVGLLLTVGARRLLRRGQAGRAADLQVEVDLGAYYSRHIYDILEALQKVLSGAIPAVTTATFIEDGILQPARDFLMQRPDEDVRLSILVPDDGNWQMAFAAGYRLESRQRFSLPIVGSFSRHAFESGETQWSFDLENDSRFTPHPQASRVYRSIISVPIRTGDDVVAVYNTDSTLEWAFPFADFIYVNLLGAIISVVWALDAPVPLGLMGGGNDDNDRDVY
jgi:hypothetical protein